MKKILVVAVVGILLIMGFGHGIVVSQEIEQKNQHAHANILIINNDKFEIKAKYSYIRSYPGGGGIFIIKMTPKNSFSGYISLKINADSNLNAKLDEETLDKKSHIAELTIQPDGSTEIKTYEIELVATYHEKSRHVTFFNLLNKLKFPLISYIISRLFNRFIGEPSVTHMSNTEIIMLEVEMFDWSSDNLPDAIIKRDELIDWLEIEHPEFGTFTGESCYAYITYPAHLIVEHWTFLYANWELRICYHVMIPPYDWSELCLRERGKVDAIFAAKRESDGTTYEIPIEDYPIFYGY